MLASNFVHLSWALKNVGGLCQTVFCFIFISALELLWLIAHRLQIKLQSAQQSSLWDQFWSYSSAKASPLNKLLPVKSNWIKCFPALLPLTRVSWIKLRVLSVGVGLLLIWPCGLGYDVTWCQMSGACVIEGSQGRTAWWHTMTWITEVSASWWQRATWGQRDVH